jgi:nucleoside-diphosphate-sugar epimerase
MNICWITPQLGTAAAPEFTHSPDICLIDVRTLVDKAGNSVDVIAARIERGVSLLLEGKKVIVCCDYGISRSNAVASGILAQFKGIPLNEAVRMVGNATGGADIKLGPLNTVRSALKNSVHRIQSTTPTILMTGASGFVGKAAYSKLGEVFSVLAPSRDLVNLEAGCAQLDLLADEHNVQQIIHLANPRVYASNNALGQSLAMLRTILDVCISRNIPLVYPSGWEIYSGYAGAIFADESVPLFPSGPYGETKYLSEVLIDHYRRCAGLKCAILRTCPLYGIGGDKPKFIYTFIDKAIQSEPIVTHKYRNGDPSLDLMHVDDFVDVLLAVVRTGFIGTVNIGTGRVTSTFVIAEMIKSMLESTSSIEQMPIDADTAIISMNCRKALDVLHWRPRISLEKGLAEIVNNRRNMKGQQSYVVK